MEDVHADVNAAKVVTGCARNGVKVAVTALGDHSSGCAQQVGIPTGIHASMVVARCHTHWHIRRCHAGERGQKKPSEYVLAGARGGPLEYRLWRKHLTAAKDVSGVHVNAHWLRHYFATMTLAACVPVQEVSAYLGRSTSRIAETCYRKFINLDRKGRASEIDALVAKAKKRSNGA